MARMDMHLYLDLPQKMDKKAVNEPLPANKEGLGLTSIINVLGSDYRSIYSVDRKTQQVSMYLESKNADEMTRMKDTIYNICNHVLC